MADAEQTQRLIDAITEKVVENVGPALNEAVREAVTELVPAAEDPAAANDPRALASRAAERRPYL